MPNSALLDEFGQKLVRLVRDEMITSMDDAMENKRQDMYSRYLYSRLQQLSPECRAFLQELTPFIVDGTICAFLQMVDCVEDYSHRLPDSLRLEILDASGQYTNLRELTDGLEAEYGWKEGWAATMSSQRKDTIRIEAHRLAEINDLRP